ncbi:HMG-Y-related protein A [Ananas comosus]|uniref:HMG-Y-related protein A n=1 Tax=Ananas comosus TaxID=4615 RepID=A0A199VQ52_ANACO|nr:HMG-Y-related protein A [Ananas comosus]
MIMAAITALNEPNGSNKTSISKYIQSNYGELPPSHSALLKAHLMHMRQNGELVFIKNNYFVAGPDAPPKRGRGRPPKSEARGPPGFRPAPPPRPAPPRPQGASSGRGRGRGRPRKVPLPDHAAASASTSSSAAAMMGAAPPPQPGKRGRGRPRKVRPEEANDGF